MCTRQERREGKCPSVPVDCGYRATVSDGSITIYPTASNASNCQMVIGIGDATFQLDPKNPPESLRRLLTADANGSFVPQLSFGGTRHTKSFTGVSQVTETHTNPDGEEVAYQVDVLDGYVEESAKGTYVSQGYRNVKSGGTTRRVDW